MRTLLELHYDDLNAQKEIKKQKKRGPVFATIAYAHRKQLNQKLLLPSRVKEILRCPKDETNINKLELLLIAIRSEIAGETTIHITSEDQMEDLAKTIENCTTKIADEVGEGSALVPNGARLMIEVEARTLTDRRAKIAEVVRSLNEGDTIKVKMKPYGTCREPPMDPFSRDLMKNPDKTVQQLLIDSSIEEVRDRLLLSLWDSLFLACSEVWTEDQVANTSATQALELGYWFHRGRTFSKKPLFEGVCAMCGVLLYGVQAHCNNALSNAYPGPPLNRDGVAITKDGEPDPEAQPPFLLRWSPQLFAKECPEMFSYDARTNRLVLKPDREPPWKKSVDRTKDKTKTWLYCIDCKIRYMPDTGQKQKTHLPFRDRASQMYQKPNLKATPVETADDAGTQPEPEPETVCEKSIDLPLQEEEVEEEGLIPDLPTQDLFPTLEQYEQKWERQLANHARTIDAEFSNECLVPKPIPNLWQDCPYVSFDCLTALVCTCAQTRYVFLNVVTKLG